MIGTLDVIVIDCPDPASLANFYGEILGMRAFEGDDGWVELVGPDGGRPLLGFQRVDDYREPEWPGQLVPQQLHLDVKVDDLDVAEALILELGARATGSVEPTFRVYLDPAGHPFCLIRPTD